MIYLVGLEGNNQPEVKMHDMLVSLLHLDQPATKIKAFLKQLTVYPNLNELPLQIKETLIISIKDSFTFYEDGYFTLDYKSEFDWTILNLLYSMYASIKPQDIVSKVINFNERKSLNMFTIRQKVIELEEAKDNFTLNLFDYREFLAECKKNRIKYVISKDRIILTFKNVKVGSSKEGFIIYDYIHIAVKAGAIDGFVFRFKDFDYSSYWNLPLVLHPNLGYNHSSLLSGGYRISKQVALLKNSIRSYNPNIALRPMREIVMDFMKYRRLWYLMKFSGDGRDYLSKQIFNRVVEINEGTDDKK